MVLIKENFWIKVVIVAFKTTEIKIKIKFIN